MTPAQSELHQQLLGLKNQRVKRLAFTVAASAASMTAEQKLAGVTRFIRGYREGRVTKLSCVGDAPRPTASA
jgi:hypothetical protein